jgi:hypothetical protein
LQNKIQKQAPCTIQSSGNVILHPTQNQEEMAMMSIRKKFSFIGIVVGAIVDVVGSNVWGFVIMMFIVFKYRLVSTPPSELTGAITSIMTHDPLIFILNLIIGGGFTLLGGYVAAHIAKHNELLNGACAAIYCVGAGLFAILSGMDTYPIWLSLLFLLADPALGMLGGFLKAKQRAAARQKVAPVLSTGM